MNFSHLIVLISFLLFLEVHCSSIVVAKSLFRNDHCRYVGRVSKNATMITLQPDVFFCKPPLVVWVGKLTSQDSW